jgi:hypothetical protein
VARPRTRSTGLALLPALALLAAADGRSGPRDDLPFERVEDAGFAADAAPPLEWPLDVLASDADADGDTDLLIHWHLFRPLELYENRGGRFVLRNRPGRDTSGLDDNRGVPDLFADAEALGGAIRLAGVAGLYVWHDVDRHGAWRFLWLQPDPAGQPLRLELETSLEIRPGEGLSADEVEQPDARRLRIELAGAERAFAVATHPIGVQLLLRPAAGVGGARPPVFAGAARTALGGERLELWKPDPHGIAWVQVEGSPLPELFVTRGALGGRLAPPLDPKEDLYYVADPTGYRRAPPGALPLGYGRGRRAAWVDADGDGRLDLSLSNESSPNALLTRDDSGAFRDRAPELGLAFEGAAVQAWADFDGDGRDDLFFLGDGAIDLARVGEDGRFHVTAGAELGLRVPASPPARGPIDAAALQLSDFDADGDLDLWLAAHGREGALRLFRREGERFRDVTREAGLAGARGTRGLVLLDADDDGLPDAVSFGGRTLLWRNEAGQRFRATPLGPLLGEPIHAAAALDADADGRVDLVLVGRRRHLLRNRATANGSLDVVLRAGAADPVGALVRAHYADGRTRAQRLGSAHSSAFSQSIQPLHFGISDGVRLESLSVRWPGLREEERVPVTAPGRVLVVRRPRVAPARRQRGGGSSRSGPSTSRISSGRRVGAARCPFTTRTFLASKWSAAQGPMLSAERA